MIKLKTSKIVFLFNKQTKTQQQHITAIIEIWDISDINNTL